MKTKKMIALLSACALSVFCMTGCGEAAADPLLTPLFISFGLKEYSVSPNAILSSRSSIAKWTRKEADKITEEVMKCATEAEVMKCLTNYSIKSSCPGL